jgi:hypothetical protein
MVGLASLSLADEPKKGNGKELMDKGKQTPTALTVDFSGQLGLGYEYLRTFGARIDLARTVVDPVDLAAAAQELAAAEKVSGKQASIKAADLTKETVEAAERRNMPEELKGVAALITDEQTRKDLETRAASAEKARSARQGEKKRGIQGTLSVYNNTDRTVTIWVNDQYMGYVDANSETSYYIGDSPFNDTKLFGRSGSTTWGPRYVPQSVGDYTWNLTP